MSYRQQGYNPRASQSQARKRTSASTGHAASAPRAHSKKKRRRHPLRVFLLLTVFAFLATSGVLVYTVYEEIDTVIREGTFYPGVVVDGVELHGATPQQAKDLLLAQAQQDLAHWAIELQFGSDGHWRIDTETLGISLALENAVIEEVNKAFMVGREGTSIIDRYRTIIGLKTEPYIAYTANVQKNMAQIDAILSQIETAVYLPAKDATMYFEPSYNNPIVTTQEVMGRELDREGLKASIVKMVNAMEAGTIQVPTREVKPGVALADLSNRLSRIASITTDVDKHSTAARNENLRIGCERLNGKIISNGQEVSFNNVVKKRTPQNGYQEALEIVSGELKMGYGGGICQVSSTLYNAVIQAGLKVKERRNHGIPVRYLPLGADATVTNNGTDFVFVNNTGADIYIIARLDSSNGGKKFTCVIEIYGRPEPNGHSYELDHEILEEIPIPEKKVTVKDTEATHVTYIDQQEEVKGAVGYRVRTFLVTRDARGNIISSEQIGTDTYEPVPTRIYTGVTSR